MVSLRLFRSFCSSFYIAPLMVPVVLVRWFRFGVSVVPAVPVVSFRFVVSVLWHTPSELVRPGLAVRVDSLQLLYEPACTCWKLRQVNIKPLLHVETFSCNLCATALRNMFQLALHRVTLSVSWNFLNSCCETSFTKSRTAFYFCNGRNDRSGDKNASFTV